MLVRGAQPVGGRGPRGLPRTFRPERPIPGKLGCSAPMAKWVDATDLKSVGRKVMPVRPRLGAPPFELYSAKRSGAGTHQMSIGPRRPRNSNCGSCKNEVVPAFPFVSAEMLRAAATVQENNTSPARARLQSLAATFTVSPTNVRVLRFGGPRKPKATSPKC